MPRPIWKGHISFGLVNIPVVLYPAESRKELHFNLLDSRNRARVKFERVNEVTGEQVPWNEVVKAYEYEDGNYVVVSDEDFKKAAVEATQTVEIEDFVDAADIDVMYYDRPYYLAPDRKGEKGYVLLRETLKKTGKAGIAKVVIRTKQYLAAVLVREPALVLELLRFRHELRDLAELELPPASAKSEHLSTRELDMAVRLVESMAGDWDPAKYKDDYRDSLLRWIERKAEQGESAPAPEAEEKPRTTQVVNIMELLQRSVEEKSRKRGKPPAKSRAAEPRKRRA